jgi:hypothetical protein
MLRTTAFSLFLTIVGVSQAGQMFWTVAGDNSTRSIYRASLDGSNLTKVFEGSVSQGVANFIDVDSTQKQLFIYGWENDVNTGPGFVKRSNLNGNNLTTIIDQDLFTLQYGFAIDKANSRMYLGSSYPWKRANLNGTDLIELPNPPNTPRYTHDVQVADYVYFTKDDFGGGLFRMTFDGTDLVQLVPGVHVFGLALDLANNGIFYSVLDDGFSTGSNGSIFRYDVLTGTSHLVISGVGAVDLELDSSSGNLFALTRSQIVQIDLQSQSVLANFPLPETGGASGSLVLVSIPESSSFFLSAIAASVFLSTGLLRRRWRLLN